MKDRKSTLRGFARPLRSALRVWLPSRRFSPFDPVPVLFHTGGAPGIHPSEFPSPGRYPAFLQPGMTHIPFNPAVFPPPKRRAGPMGLGFWALTLPEAPGDRAMFYTPDRWLLPWV